MWIFHVRVIGLITLASGGGGQEEGKAACGLGCWRKVAGAKIIEEGRSFVFVCIVGNRSYGITHAHREVE